jgi:DNA invertase Pin-like site-specific DNA recombinase
MEKAIGYVRVSTTVQAEEGCSLVLQREKIAAYAKLNDLELVDIVEDAGISGTKMERDGLNDVRARVEKREVKHVIIYKLDRMARNLSGAIKFSEHLQEHGAQLHSVTEKINTDSPMGKLFFNIMGAMGAFEVEQLRLRTRQALQGKKERGEVYNHVSYGFQLSADGKHLEPHPKEQKVIRKIRKLHKEGISLNLIAGKLNSLGYVTKHGKVWTHKQITKILSA